MAGSYEDQLQAEGQRRALAIASPAAFKGANVGVKAPPSPLPKDAPYPKDFTKVYNSALVGFESSKATGDQKAMQFWDAHMSALEGQKRVYDYVNSNGLNNLPDAVQQHIATQPQFNEWQHPSYRAPADEPPQPQSNFWLDMPRRAAPSSGGSI